MRACGTNTLVALGAAIFVTYSHVVPDGAGDTRIAAQVVWGIGFLGAGVIFKEGLNVRGLNTAATLWCSAAVGLLAGEGLALYGLLAAAFVLCDVAIAIGSTGEHTDASHLCAMPLATPTAFQNLGTLIFSNHALNLQ